MHAAQLVSLEGSPGSLRKMVVNEPLLSSMITKIGKLKVCSVCVCGPAREGKSFLLGYIMRCLNAMVNGDMDDWMDLGEPKKPLNPCFEFKNSSEPVTQGILIWPEPFFIRGNDGIEKAVLLIDTQGTYDEFTSEREMKSIVGLSMLMSSLLIFNFSKNLKEDILGSLETYVEYGKLQMEESSSTEKPFQSLKFLIRDWNIPDEYAFGKTGGEKFIRKKLEMKEGQSGSAKRVRRLIHDCFEDITCFLLPNIGEKALQSGFTGSVAELATKFSKKLEELITHLVQHELQVKRILGRGVDMVDFSDALNLYVAAFNASEFCPEDMWGATKDVNNSMIVKKAIDKYQSKMNKSIFDILREEDLEAMHHDCQKVAQKYFSENAESDANIRQVMSQLMRKLNEKYDYYKDENRKKKLQLVADVQIETMQKCSRVVEETISSWKQDDFKDADSIKLLKKTVVQGLLKETRIRLNRHFDTSEVNTEVYRIGSCVENRLEILQQHNEEIRKAIESHVSESITAFHVALQHNGARIIASYNCVNEDEFESETQNIIKGQLRELEEITKTRHNEIQKSMRKKFDVGTGECMSRLLQHFRDKVSSKHSKFLSFIQTEVDHYKELLDFALESNGERVDVLRKLQDKHVAKVSQILEKFRSIVDIPTQSKLFKVYYDKLRNELEGVKENVLDKKALHFEHKIRHGAQQVERLVQKLNMDMDSMDTDDLKFMESSQAVATKEAKESLDYLLNDVPADVKESLLVGFDRKANTICETKRLNTELSSTKKQLELQQAKLEEEKHKLAVAGILDQARLYYNSEMENLFTNAHLWNEAELNSHHQQVLRTTVVKFGQSNPNISAALKTKLLEYFQKYVDKFHLLKSMQCDDVAIGIDLGTTYCCVGVYLNGNVEILENSNGSKLTPSYVSFNADGTQTVGEYAKGYAFGNVQNTIYDAKRMLGRSWKDPKLNNDMKFWPFLVTPKDDTPMIQIEDKMYYPEQISAKLLKYLKSEAEKKIGRTVSKAVITVPAYFTDGQRQATLDAAEIADIEVLEIISEPTAAAIAYRYRRFYDEARNAIIYDLGGGTFDIAVIQIRPNEIKVLAVDGDTHLGGQDFDQKIIDECMQKIRTQTKIDLSQELKSRNKNIQFTAKGDLYRLRNAAENAKKMLSTNTSAKIQIEQLRGMDVHLDVKRDWFETANRDLFERTIELIERALQVAKLKSSDIHEIVMVGGSSRIPKIHDMLKQRLNVQSLNNSINPDEAVAYGAAYRAAKLSGAKSTGSLNFSMSVHDVTPMSLGTECINNVYSVIIPRGSPIPCEFKRRYKTADDNQTNMLSKIYQGEHIKATENAYLGEICTSGIPKKPKGTEGIDLTLKISRMGILDVEAVLLSTRSKGSLQINCEKNRLPENVKIALREYERSSTLSSTLPATDVDDFLSDSSSSS